MFARVIGVVHPMFPMVSPQELEILARLRDLENEAKDERIAVLEREIAEDKHIHALKVTDSPVLWWWWMVDEWKMTIEIVLIASFPMKNDGELEMTIETSWVFPWKIR